MAITHWPLAERPREKLLRQGVGALSDAELLAIFLRTGVSGKTAVDLARELLSQFSGLRPLLEANLETFCAGHGLGIAKYTQLQAVLEMGRRYLAETLQHQNIFSCSLEAKRYVSAQLRHERQEVFACLFLNNQHEFLGFDKLFFGGINRVAIHPREVVKKALHHGAAAVILAHNHPSGCAEPSGADEAVTRQITEALKLIEVAVLDHLIVGDAVVTSFSERGLL